jgi:Multicopper oxidase
MMKRRDFLKLGTAGAATLLIGSRIPGFLVKNAYAATQNLTITITDGLKDMHTKNTPSVFTDPNPIPGQCYYWIYKVTADGKNLPPDAPGPTICAVKGDTINLSIFNDLDEPHSFYIPGIFDSGPIAPGATFNGVLTASVSGAHLYYDNLNEPVNRVMGLHGALIVRPATAVPGHNFTPYDNPTPHVQAIYDAFGTSVWPGLRWEDGDPTTNTPAFRQYSWILHQSSPNLFAAVRDAAPNSSSDPTSFRNPVKFQTAFLRDPFSPTRANNIPQYFTINGQSGFFSHFSPTVTPIGRIGEPIVIHIMNAGLWTHSMHYHFNHVYITYDSSPSNGGVFGGGVSTNPIWVDIYNIDPMDTVDYTMPWMRQPNIPTMRGLGLPEAPVQTINGHPCYPPVEEMNVYMPKIGTTAKDVNGNTISLAQRESPLCYPMHDHSEASQTAQGGNYNTGMISGVYSTGDRNMIGQKDVNGNFLATSIDFPMDADFAMMYRNIRGVSVASVADPSRGTLPAPGTDPTLPPI